MLVVDSVVVCGGFVKGGVKWMFLVKNGVREGG